MQERSLYFLTDKGDRRRESLLSKYDNYWPRGTLVEWYTLDQLSKEPSGLSYHSLAEEVSSDYGSDLRDSEVFGRILSRLVRRGYIQREQPFREESVQPSLESTTPDSRVPFTPVDPFRQPRIRGRTDQSLN